MYRYLRNKVLPRIGDMPLAKITTDDTRAIVFAKKDQGRGSGNLSASRNRPAVRWRMLEAIER